MPRLVPGELSGYFIDLLPGDILVADRLDLVIGVHVIEHSPSAADLVILPLPELHDERRIHRHDQGP